MFFFGLIVGVVLVIAAIANMILTNLSDIISVLASFIFLGWTIIQTVREIELPDPLREAYRSLWNENSRFREYLVEYKGMYYVAIEAGYDSQDYNSTELFKESCLNAKEYLLSYEKKGCRLIIGHGTGPDEADNELYFLVPALISKEEFGCIKDILTEYIFEGNSIPIPEPSALAVTKEDMLGNYAVTLHETYDMREPTKSRRIRQKRLKNFSVKKSRTDQKTDQKSVLTAGVMSTNCK